MKHCAACGGVAPSSERPPWELCVCFGGPLDEQGARRLQLEREQRQQAALERVRQGAP